VSKNKISRLRTFSRNARAIGIWGALQWTIYRARKRRAFFPPRSNRVRPRGFRRPLEMRGNDSSDADVFDQVFLGEEYSPLLGDQPSVIFDLGANIGLSSAWFLHRFPMATVLAVEPDPDNFALCRKNLAMFGARAQVLLGAVWSKRTKLSLSRGSFGDGKEWASQVVERTASDARIEVDGWDIPSLLSHAGTNMIDLLKVDIEKGELELFSSACETWIPFVRTICIELHGKDCEELFFGALRNFDFTLIQSGELTTCKNLRVRSAVAVAGHT
jgi:FkbM family methyltransferase